MSKTFKFKHGGVKEHEIGDINCPRCSRQKLDGTPFTHRTLDNQGEWTTKVLRYPHICTCGGLVHSEIVGTEDGYSVHYECEKCHSGLA